MKLAIDVYLDYELEWGDSALLTLTAADTQGQVLLENHLEVEDAVLSWIDGEGGLGQRLWAIVSGRHLRLHYRAKVEVTRPDLPLHSLAATPFRALPAEVITYLRPSRLCPSDLFATFVAKEFGHLEGGVKIAAIRDWIAETLSYVSGSSSSATTAADTFVTREGVCRDFTHLLCSLSRAAGIPARYTSGYSPDVSPPDFHAVAEVWLDGAWHLVDATGMSSPAGFVVIGAGRDAGDVSFLETEGPAQYIHQRIEVSRI